MPDATDQARLIGTDEKVRVLCRCNGHVLIVGKDGAAWLPSGRVALSRGEWRNALAARTAGELIH